MTRVLNELALVREEKIPQATGWGLKRLGRGGWGDARDEQGEGHVQSER
jgi:hypothetical protein